jgi:hypothetical protein
MPCDAKAGNRAHTCKNSASLAQTSQKYCTNFIILSLAASSRMNPCENIPSYEIWLNVGMERIARGDCETQLRPKKKGQHHGTPQRETLRFPISLSVTRGICAACSLCSLCSLYDERLKKIHMSCFRTHRTETMNVQNRFEIACRNKAMTDRGLKRVTEEGLTFRLS